MKDAIIHRPERGCHNCRLHYVNHKRCDSEFPCRIGGEWRPIIEQQSQGETEEKPEKRMFNAISFVESCGDITEYVSGAKVAHRFKGNMIPVIEYNELRGKAKDFEKFSLLKETGSVNSYDTIETEEETHTDFYDMTPFQSERYLGQVPLSEDNAKGKSAEEILEKRTGKKSGYFSDDVINAMEEYASQFKSEIARLNAKIKELDSQIQDYKSRH